MTIKHLSEQQAVEAVRHHLQLDAPSSCPPLERHFELLRATVWSIAAASRLAHVNRVLSVALPIWRLLAERTATSDETLRAELHGALSTLKGAGDLVGLSGGYWSPATARLVELPGGSDHLLVGGVPSALLPLSGSVICFHGPHRRISNLSRELAAALPRELFDAWAGRPPGRPLRAWKDEVFSELERSPYVPSDEVAFEYYLPARSRPRTPQYFRWFERAEGVEGTLLARRRRLYGAREHRLVDVSKGRVTHACELHSVDVRRLMYALDLEANNPVCARTSRRDTQTECLLTSELPRAEQRALAAFGTLTIPDARRFERQWTLKHNEADALDMLRALGIIFE